MTTQTACMIGEQAHALRDLMQRVQHEPFEGGLRASFTNSNRPARSIAVTSGKGGVGKSNIALNLAIALARLDARTCLLDANMGLGNIDLLCGLNGYWNLSHVVTGGRSLSEITLAGPEGIGVITGAGELGLRENWTPAARSDVDRQFEELDLQHDFLVVDTAACVDSATRALVSACDLALIVTTAEPTSIADAYGTIKSLSASGIPQIEVLINQCHSAQQAQLIGDRVRQTARTFLHLDVTCGGFIPLDPHVAAAVHRRTPFLLSHPQSPASLATSQLASRLKRLCEAQPAGNSLLTRLTLSQRTNRQTDRSSPR